jgi:photosystem II stability/assembly factor-like uncharacterized protein
MSMKKTIIVLFLFQQLIIKKCSAQWIEVFNDSSYEWFSDVKFINDDTGFACGTFWPSSDAVIMKTVNGGVTWDSSLFCCGWMMSLSVVNDSVIYTGGQDGHLFKTNNTGTTWDWQPNAIPCCSDVSTIYFLNADTGFALGMYQEFWETTDGSDWNGVSMPGASYFPNNSSIQFLNDSDGFVVKKKIYRTSDSGHSWTQLIVDTNRYFTSLFMRNLLEGFAIDDEGYIFSTSDGGLTWSLPYFLGPYPLYDIAFVTDSIGYIIGGNDIYHSQPPHNFEGVIYKTADGGYSWSLFQTFDHALTSMTFVNDSVGYAVGHRGKILKINNANKVGVLEIGSSEDIAIFPNPASSTFTIQSNSPLQNTSIKIFNLLGEEVYNAEYKDPFTVDCQHFPSGLYFVKLQTEKGSVVEKLLIQK